MNTLNTFSSKIKMEYANHDRNAMHLDVDHMVVILDDGERLKLDSTKENSPETAEILSEASIRDLSVLLFSDNRFVSGAAPEYIDAPTRVSEDDTAFWVRCYIKNDDFCLPKDGPVVSFLSIDGVNLISARKITDKTKEKFWKDYVLSLVIRREHFATE